MIGRLGRSIRNWAAIAAALFLLLHVLPVTPWITRQMAEWDEPAAAGGTMIVLGAEQNYDGTVGFMTYWRCISAVRAWRTGNYAKVLVSGGAYPPPSLKPEGGPAPPQLAGAMAEFMTGLGVPEADIVIESKSLSTRQNAVNSAALLRTLPGPYTLITSDFHSWRAKRCFARVNIDVVSQPAPDLLKRYADWNQRWPASMWLAQEWVKLGYYWWQSWI